MKFKITCDNCDYVFLTEAESRQTVQCQCPHCGGLMKIKLPDVPEGASAARSEDSECSEDSELSERSSLGASPSEPRRRTGCGIVVGIFLGLFILVLLAMVAYSLTRHESTQPVEDPYARIIDDSTYYNDGYVEEEEKPDTVERHVEQHKEVRDTVPVGANLDIDPHERIDPHEFINITAPNVKEPPTVTEPNVKEPPTITEPTIKSERNQNTN